MTADDVTPGAGDALVVVDVQNDFLPGGALGVAGGDAILPVIARLLARFAALGLPVVATRDWHPADHCSFRARGGPWPPHCIVDSAGAAFAPTLEWPAATVVVSKATTPERDAYSAFAGTDLEQRLRAAGVRRIVVAGLATDYCVVNTALDARAAGFDVVVVRDGVAAVDVAPGDGARALMRIAEAGARLVDSSELLAEA